jgi:glycerophosphoryl diester phosphodiesterase
MVVSHGGDWDPVFFPYGSMPAFKKAFADGSEAVKGDFRVSADNVGVIMHSSPIKPYESLECAGKLVQNMTVAKCTSCRMALTHYTFSSLPELLSWSEGKVVVMLCVKRAEDIARAISSVVELNATNRVFLEIHVDNLMEHVLYAKPPGWQLPMTFMFEFYPGYHTWDVNLTETSTQLHARGMRTFAATTEILPSVESHIALFNSGIDVVYTYHTQNAVVAREKVNRARGISNSQQTVSL